MDTAIYPKDSEDIKPGTDTWPDDKLFYLLTSEGLMICRNTEFYRSCVPARKGPGELEPQKPFMRLRYPKIPQAMIEQVVGFFSDIQKKHDSEAYVCLCWDKEAKQYELICPEQNISGGHVDYELPDVPANLVIVGDIHSHVNMSAFSSGTDENDEHGRPGIHLVVGRIKSEPPQFHCEAVVDGMRFAVDVDLILENYEKRAEYPAEWMEAITAKKSSWLHPAGQYSSFKSGNKQFKYTGQENDWGGMVD